MGYLFMAVLFYVCRLLGILEQRLIPTRWMLGAWWRYHRARG